MAPGMDVPKSDWRGKAPEEFLEVGQRFSACHLPDFGEKILLRSLFLAPTLEHGKQLCRDLDLVVPPRFEVVEKDHGRVSVEFDLPYFHIQCFPKAGQGSI